MNLLKKNKDKCILFGLIALHTLLFYLLCDFPKAMENYCDEPIYYNIAKSIAEGRSFSLHGVSLTFINVLYPLILSPLMRISNITIRMRMIVVINSLLNSLVMVPTFYICKELRLKNRLTWLFLFIVFIWPDSINSATLMSENLFFILCTTTIYLCIRYINSKRKTDLFFVILFSILSFLTKEIGLCIPLALIAEEVLRFCLDLKKNKSDSKEQYMGVLHIFLALMCFLAVIVFIGLHDSYISNGVISFDALFNEYSFLYFFYALGYYSIAVVLAVGIIPVVLCISTYEKTNEQWKNILHFVVLLIIGTIVVIGLTISTKEDIGKSIPRVHMRYLYPATIIIFPLGFKCIDIIERYSLRRMQFYIIGYLAVFALFFKGIYLGSSIQCNSLLYIYKIREVISDLHTYKTFEGHDDITFYRSIIITVFVMGIVATLLYIFIKKEKEKYAFKMWCVIYSLLCIVNIVLAYEVVHNSYSVDEKMIEEMTSINNYFVNNDLNGMNVMLITDDAWSKESKVYDTYFDASPNSFEITTDVIRSIAAEHKKEIDDITFREPLLNNEYNINKIDYFIIPKNSFIFSHICNTKKIENIGGGTFDVYQNMNACKLDIESPQEVNLVMTSKGTLREEIDFYVNKGMSNPEDMYTWTDGNECIFNLSMFDGKECRISIDVCNTYNGDQNYYVLKNGMLLSFGNVNGSGNISFNVNMDDNIDEVLVYFPNACSPKANGESDDGRMLALAITNISINVVE